jgi:hypothetical protein
MDMKVVLLALVIVGLMVVAPIASADGGCASCGLNRGGGAYAGSYGGGYGYAQPVSYGYTAYDYSVPMMQTTSWTRGYGVYTYDPFSHGTYGYSGYGYGYGGSCGCAAPAPAPTCGCSAPAPSPCGGGCGCGGGGGYYDGGYGYGGGLFGHGGFLGTGLFR